jgi:type II secretory pathway pseudopilin PulG
MPGRVAPAPDSVPKAVWIFLMENAQWVAVTVTIAVLIVVIVPPMVGTQRTARDVVAQACAGALHSELAAGESAQDLQALLKRPEVHTACADPALHIIPLTQPSTYAVQNSNGKHTYVVTPTSITRTP